MLFYCDFEIYKCPNWSLFFLFYFFQKVSLVCIHLTLILVLIWRHLSIFLSFYTLIGLICSHINPNPSPKLAPLSNNKCCDDVLIFHNFFKLKKKPVLLYFAFYVSLHFTIKKPAFTVHKGGAH
jgi:hypothetical protein